MPPSGYRHYQWVGSNRSTFALGSMYQPVRVLSQCALLPVFRILIGSSVDHLRLTGAAIGWCVALNHLAGCRHPVESVRNCLCQSYGWNRKCLRYVPS